MSEKIVNYQCPACGGALRFDGASGKLVCDYCDSSYEVSEIEALYAKKEAEALAEAEKEREKAESEANWAEEAKMKAYNCPSCGAQLICDETTAATQCPYCGNPTVMVSRFAKTLKPDCMIPFKLDKKDAMEALKKHFSKKPLLPPEFSDQHHIEEVKGVYVPFWLYNADCNISGQFAATRSTSHRQGDYKITKTDHFNLFRAGTVSFEKVPVDASSKADDDYMDSIEPFDYSEIVPFSTAYLPGYMADRYDEDEEMCADRAVLRMRNTAESELYTTTGGYMTVTPVSQSINVDPKSVKYALLPVWMLSTRWNDKIYMFAMNGQTGKMVGNLPVSNKKRAFYFLTTAAATFVAACAIIAAVALL